MAKNSVRKMQADPKLKKEMSWKNNLFARYILLRYSLALFFFANVYWIMILLYHSIPVIIVPVFVLILIVLASSEQLRLYGQKEAVLDWTKRAFQGQALANSIAIILTFIPGQFTRVFPVFANNMTGKTFVIALQVLGLALVFLNLEKINRIGKNTDHFYIRFQKAFGKIS